MNSVLFSFKFDLCARAEVKFHREGQLSLAWVTTKSFPRAFGSFERPETSRNEQTSRSQFVWHCCEIWLPQATAS
jgi:hypothetical protein